MRPEDLAELATAERDEHGHIRIAEINFGDISRRASSKRLAELGSRPRIVPKNIGYEVRCADPIPFDMEYTRDLGYCAAQVHHRGRHRGARFDPATGASSPSRSTRSWIPQTGRMRVRMVDIQSDRYRIAFAYMLRLKRADFEDSRELARLAAAAYVTPERFRSEFGYLVEREIPA